MVLSSSKSIPSGHLSSSPLRGHMYGQLLQSDPGPTSMCHFTFRSTLQEIVSMQSRLRQLFRVPYFIPHYLSGQGFQQWTNCKISIPRVIFWYRSYRVRLYSAVAGVRGCFLPCLFLLFGVIGARCSHSPGVLIPVHVVMLPSQVTVK